MNNVQPETETAFGRPASWWAALPAAMVGCGAFLIAVYGTWWMPARLPAHYKNALEQLSNDYHQLATSQSSSVSWRIGERAGELDVIYSRLTGLERGDASRYWQWAEFLQSHARTVQRKLQSSSVTAQPEVRERLLKQADQFDAKAREIFDQLAAGKSALRSQAVVRGAQWKYQQGLGEYGVGNAAKLADTLRDALEELSLNNSTQTVDGMAATGDRTASQIDEARLLQVKLMIEAAWQRADGSRLVANQNQLQEAWELLKIHRPPSGDAAIDLQWQCLEHVLAAMSGRAVPEPVTIPHRTRALKTSGNDWSLELADLQLAAVAGDWQEISFGLTRSAADRSVAVTSGLARTICRLACSPQTSPTNHWGEKSELGLLLVAQLAPHLPELAELLWLCARAQVADSQSPTSLNPAIPEAIARGQSGMLKHSVSALAATLAGQPTVARTHMELIRRGQGSLALVARTALWRAQIVAVEIEEPATNLPNSLKPEHKHELTALSGLMSVATQLEPDSGLNWFTLGTLQFRLGELPAMRNSLQRASQILGSVPAIEQMLRAAGE